MRKNSRKSEKKERGYTKCFILSKFAKNKKCPEKVLRRVCEDLMCFFSCDRYLKKVKSIGIEWFEWVVSLASEFLDDRTVEIYD